MSGNRVTHPGSKSASLVIGLVGVSLVVCEEIAKNLIPDLLPKLSRQHEWMLLGLVLLPLAVHGLSRLWARLTARFPRPWWPSRPWHLRRWLAERPSLTIQSVMPGLDATGDIVSRFEVRLMVSRGVGKATSPVSFRFEDAVATLAAGKSRLRLRPVEAGGFLSLPVVSGQGDTVLLDFADASVPRPVSDYADLHAGYHVVLSGVRAELGGGRSVAGTLPPASWYLPSTVQAAVLEPNEVQLKFV